MHVHSGIERVPAPCGPRPAENLAQARGLGPAFSRCSVLSIPMERGGSEPRSKDPRGLAKCPTSIRPREPSGAFAAVPLGHAGSSVSEFHPTRRNGASRPLRATVSRVDIGWETGPRTRRRTSLRWAGGSRAWRPTSASKPLPTPGDRGDHSARTRGSARAPTFDRNSSAWSLRVSARRVSPHVAQTVARLWSVWAHS
jgi:hypothetical protein